MATVPDPMEARMRLPATLLLALSLAACGFHPRAQLRLPESLGPVRVQTADPYSPLAQELSTALRRAGATAAAGGEPAALLGVLSERMATRPLSVDTGAQVREYETTYTGEFDLRGADGGERLARQSLSLTREYTYDALASAGSPAEQALLEDELRREMQSAILRRLDAALRAD